MSNILNRCIGRKLNLFGYIKSLKKITVAYSFTNNKLLYLWNKWVHFKEAVILCLYVSTVAHNVDLFRILRFYPDVTAGMSQLYVS